jgi:deoxycytidylate deaminase/thymidylate synthase ThyX
MDNANNPSNIRPTWDEYFLNLVTIVGSRGTCDRGHAGCVITKEKRILSTGYAGAPVGLDHCDEVGHEMHTVIHSDGHESRHCIRTTHAEQNAIAQAARSGISIKGSTLYINMTPCYTCAKMLINAGIIRVVCAKDYHASQRSKEIFEQAGVELVLLSQDVTEYSDSSINKTVTTTTSTTIEPQKETIRKDGYQVFLYDEFSPEDTAMMQALYSRSPLSVAEHVDKVRQSGSGKFMEKFYVGYGHASIADCGSTTLFIEGLSILADKAIQDWPLYSGQETSTRYVDMSKQAIIDPIKTPESKIILDTWMKFYVDNQERIQEHLKQKYPIKPGEKEIVYNKAIAARGYDIMRGFLPAGITTQLSWHTNLRQAWDKLALLRHNPLPEVKQIANEMLSQLKEKYSHSFSHELDHNQEQYRKVSNEEYSFYDPISHNTEFQFNTDIKVSELNQYTDILARPPKTGLPHFLTELGLNRFEFLLDYGSFRDLQRHRNGVCRMPLLTTKYGFHNWYLEQLPDDLRFVAENIIKDQTERITQLSTSPEIKQYYISLGFNMPCRVTYGLPATVYVIELRSGKPVHPTLRKIAHQMHHAVSEAFPNLKLNSDLGKDDWDVRRGLQDITKKE